MGNLPPEVDKINIGVSSYSSGTATIGGSEVSVAGLSSDDSQRLKKDLGLILAEEKSPTVQDIISRHGDDVLTMVRRVNKETGNGYKGMFAEGKQLQVNPIAPTDIERGGSQLTTWERDISTTGTTDWLYSSDNHASLGEQQGVVIFGAIDRVSVPKINRIRLWKNNKKVPESLETMLTRQTMDDNELPVYELRETIFGFPEEEFYIDANAYATGTDRLQPIGFVVGQAKDINLSPSTPFIGS